MQSICSKMLQMSMDSLRMVEVIMKKYLKVMMRGISTTTISVDYSNAIE